jgi:predicted phage terminase large subunit-like protein
MQATSHPAFPLDVNRFSLEASLVRESFFDFFLRSWKVLSSEKLVCNWHIEVLCNELQKVATRVFRREPKEYDLIINISPGSTKSTICSEMFLPWCWTNDPSLRMICGSYSTGLSDDLAKRSRRILQSDWYMDLFPDIKLTSEGVQDIQNTKGGERISTSTNSKNITGRHAHIIGLDDPLNPQEAMSEAETKTANDWLDQTLPSRMVSLMLTPIILITQRLGQNDSTGHFKETRPANRVRHLCFPAELGDGSNVKPRVYRSKYVNGLFDPVRLPKIVLDAKMAESPYAYAGQYNQSPIPAGMTMFEVDKIQINIAAPTITRQVRAWDKAGTFQKGCFTVGLHMGIDRDRCIWILDVVRGQWEAAGRERIIKQTAERDGRSLLIVIEEEGGSGGKESAEATVKNLMGWRVRRDRPKGDKVLRAEPFSRQVNSGNVRMVRASWNAEFIKELQFFPHGKYKDQTDSASMAFAALTHPGLVAGAFGAGQSSLVKPIESGQVVGMVR